MTGGAFGSLIAQFFHVTSVERRTLLVAGAAAGMSAAFAAPLAALLLSVELLQGWITQAAGNSFSRRSSFRQN
jgi:H+/Cl- antiporter ClcA